MASAQTPDQQPVPTKDEPNLFATEQVITFHDERVGLQAVIAIDDTTLGPGFGGVRWKPYPTTAAAVSEAQRLAQAMTLKHACAELPYGGAKSVIVGEPITGPEREQLMERFGDAVARTNGSYVPGVDMGTTLEDMQLVATRGARAFCATTSPSPWTARGVYAAMRAGVKDTLGADSVDGLVVAVQGAGSVGSELARFAARDGARVVVADVDTARAAALAQEIGGTTADTADIPFVECDVFAPSAVARVLTLDAVERLRCRVVAGAANDTLDTPEVGAALAARGITFVPDFVANAGGVIQVHAENTGMTHDELVDAIERIGERTSAILARARAEGTTPVEAAEAMGRAHIESHRADRRDA